MKESLVFKYKGARKYVHGTDIFNKTVNTLKQHGIKINQLSMSINDVVFSNLDLSIVDDKSEIGNSSVRFEIESNEKSFYCTLKENGTKVDGKYEYPEEDIIAASNIVKENNEITLSQNLNYTTIEKVVALNKGLLEQLFPSAGGKWYFVKLEITDAFFERPEIINVKMVRNMKLRLVKSSIEINNQVVGGIFFSLKK